MTLNLVVEFLLAILGFVVVGYGIKVLCAEFEISVNIRNLILLIVFVVFIIVALGIFGIGSTPLIK